MITIKILRKKSLNVSLVILMSSLAIPSQAFSDCPDFVVKTCIDRNTKAAKPAPEGIRVGFCGTGPLKLECRACFENSWEPAQKACSKKYGGPPYLYDIGGEAAR